ncbi:hypothetical protein CBS101457_002089 [Exobasidium rhododendri]|nr:hypothetical protein CBS101457_002089 [Exobasidium rhododendri]
MHLTAYQRATPSSSTSSFQGSQQQQHQKNSQNQQPPPPPPPLPQSQQRYPSNKSISSPEQIRAQSMGLNYHLPQDDYRQQHNPQHFQRHHERSISEMHETKDLEERSSGGGRRWMEEQRSLGPLPPSDRVTYGKPQSQQVPHYRDYASPHPSFSHPASPSHRPRTPPQHVYGAPSKRTSQWESSQTGPMSAPPSLVPRVNPNAPPSNSHSSTSALPQAGPISHDTSPSLPSLMRGSKGHSRIPSWGPHLNNVNNSSRPESMNTSAAPNSNGPPPPPMLPFRGQSVGLGEPFLRSEVSSNRDQIEKRKRPASESPPNSATGGGMLQLSSPNQRGDPMSMSSILGPSSRIAEVEKRRRVDDGVSAPSSTYSTTVKMEGSVPPPTSTSINSGPKLTATNVNDSPASNLARRKWSGPIAEEAAQQAAAWRAQEQRWGSSRSPKVGITPLAGPGAPPPLNEQRRTPPMGSGPFLKRGNSPSRVEGHKRQRSDGFQTLHGSPLTRTLPLRAHSPPPAKQLHANNDNPVEFHSRANPTKSSFHQQQAGEHNFYHRPGSPPPPPPPPPPPSSSSISSSNTMSQQAHLKGPPSISNQGPGVSSSPYYGSSHPYGQPSYHAYDNQSRLLDLEGDDVRGSAFASHGDLHPSLQEQVGTRQVETFNDQRHRTASAPQTKSAMPAKGLSGVQGGATMRSTSPPVHPAHKPVPAASQQGAAPARPSGIHMKERESKRRSMTPNTLGPAKGLLAPRVEERRRMHHQEANHRPTVAMKDFNLGPKVDSEAVWETLEEIERQQMVEYDDTEKGVIDASMQVGSKSRHLGSFRYDSRKSPLLPGDLLQANVGATVEVRVSGKQLGLGLTSQGDQGKLDKLSGWSLGWRAKEQEASKTGVLPPATLEERSLDGEQGDGCGGTSTFWHQEALLNRKIWGTDVYTDDSDVVAMCVHAGWIQGPTLQDLPSWVPPGKATTAWKEMTNVYVEQGLDKEETIESIANRATRAVLLDRLSSTADLSVILRIAPKLIAYKGSQRCGVKSRSWGNCHDGVSLLIESVTLRDPGYASGEKGLRNVKHRIDHLARLKTLATIAIDTINASETEQVLVEKVRDGGLIDIRVASRLTTTGKSMSGKPFWQIDVNDGKLL